ncbi:chloride channel nucleotide sensitivea [Echinococcus multilocularis]|uniref:Chloride channel nucleotide sensitivea n=1 Tax=Echinococcus multilocularis TaxID=6211 RepID=A0A068Y4S3_ECHMU|nr:chloride channel nucleotide sensitivea [Echinococcus multilocularis]
MSLGGALGNEVHLVKGNVSFYEETRLLDKGKLVVKESSIDWDGENRHFSLLYPNICLHAVSRDPYGGDENVKFPYPHVFLMVDGERVWSNGEPPLSSHGDNGMEVDDEENGDEEEGVYAADEEKTTFNLRFVPADQRDLDDLYTAIAECQALNPDPEDLSEDEFGSIHDDEDGNDGDDNEEVDPENFTDN